MWENAFKKFRMQGEVKIFTPSFSIIIYIINFYHFFFAVIFIMVSCHVLLSYFLCLRWLNTVLTVCEYKPFAKSWQEKGFSSQAETWQVTNILINYFYWQVKSHVFVVSMATWTIEYNLKISLLLSLHKIRSLDFPIHLYTAYYN